MLVVLKVYQTMCCLVYVRSKAKIFCHVKHISKKEFEQWKNEFKDSQVQRELLKETWNDYIMEDFKIGN